MAKLFQISQGTAGFSYNGTNYQFTDVDSIGYTYNRKNHLTRGASGKNKVGIIYKEGLKTPDVAEVVVKGCSIEVYDLLQTIFEGAQRISFWFVDDATGEGLTYKNAVIRDKPLQNNIGESEDTISFMFAIESFDLTPKFNDE